MEKKFSVIGVGAVNVDQVTILPRFPEEDTKTKTKFYYQQIGGPVPVALLYLQYLGINTNLIATIGSDQIGKYIKKSFPQLPEQPQKQSAISQVWINQTNGSRTIVYNRGTLTPIPPETITEEILKGSQILHFDAQEPKAAAHAADFAHKLGLTVSFDTGDFKPQSETLLKKADVVISPKRFGKTAEEIAGYGPKIAVVTDGANGINYFYEGKNRFIPSYKIKATETVGAGDIFCGALIYSLLKKTPFDDSIRFAAAAAAIKCSKIGRYFATVSEIRTLVEKTDKEWYNTLRGDEKIRRSQALWHLQADFG